jgi:hypothetical protein
MFRLKCSLAFFLSIHCGLAAAGVCRTVEPDKDPFWRRKEKVFQRLKEDRLIAVSVKTRKSSVPGFKEELYLQGAGIMNAPLEFAFTRAQRFEDYPKMSGMIKNSKFDEKSRRLDMTMAAFGYTADLKIDLEFPTVAANSRDIRFCVLEGAFKGMNGTLHLEEFNGAKSQISLTSIQGFDKLPIPKFFVEFGLEVAMQMVATKMRTFVEEAYKK